MLCIETWIIPICLIRNILKFELFAQLLEYRIKNQYKKLVDISNLFWIIGIFCVIVLKILL